MDDPFIRDPRGARSMEMYRWQGVVDSALAEHARRLDSINGDAKRAREASEKLLIEVAVLRTKITLWAGLGSLVGAGVITAIISFLGSH